MAIYPPIRRNETAIPAALSNVVRQQNAQGLSSGQINGQLQAILKTQRALPIMLSVNAKRMNIPGWSSGTVTLVSTTITVPDGKTSAVIRAFPSGIIRIDGSDATGVIATVYINGVGEQVAHPWSNDFDYSIGGTSSQTLSVTPGQVIPVRLDVTVGSHPILGSSNWGGLSVDGNFSL